MNIVATFSTVRVAGMNNLAIYLEAKLNVAKLLERELSDGTELMLVQFPDMSEQSLSDEVRTEMIKNGVKPTSVNFFLSFANKNRKVVREKEVIHSMIAFNEDGEPDMCNWLYIYQGGGAPKAGLRLDTHDCVFGPQDFFIVEKI